VFFSFYLYPELMTDLIAFHNMYLYMMVAFSTGEMKKYMFYLDNFNTLLPLKKQNIPHFWQNGVFSFLRADITS